MQINVTFDASVADAPSGYVKAINAAVKFFEQTFDTPITVNLTFGWGEVAGQGLTPSTLGASATTMIDLPYAEAPGGLYNVAGTHDLSPAIAQAILESQRTMTFETPPVITMSYAEARALNQVPEFAGVQDGYIGLNSAASYTFDPNNRAVAGKYDAIGILEHEISEVLGRQLYEGGQLLPGQPAYAGNYQMLDYFRYSATNVHEWLPGGGNFSLNGEQMLDAFNDPSNGGDAGDWSAGTHNDSFDAFADPGQELLLSTVDIRVMELLGYEVSYTAPTPNGTAVKPQTIATAITVAQGTTLSFDGPRALLLHSNGTIDNAGTITDSGLRTQIDDVGIDGGKLGRVGFTNETTGVLSVTAVDVTNDAVGLMGSLSIVNSGLIQVVSQQADAWGAFCNGFTNTSTGTVTVQAADFATGVDYGSSNGFSFSNAGMFQVTGHHAVGLVNETTFDNSGTIELTVQGAGGTGIAVYVSPLCATYTNSGLIQAPYAFYADTSHFVGSVANVKIVNTGTIDGITSLSPSNSEVDNSGTINGAIIFDDGNSIYSGAAGAQTGGIFLSHGTNTVTLGNDGEAAVGGGGTDTITGGTGNDFIEIPMGNNTIDGGGGVNTLSFADAPLAMSVDLANGTETGNGSGTVANIQTVIGSSYGGTMVAGSAAVTFIAGAGTTVLTGGAGNDTLAAGAGTSTMSGGGGNNTLIFSAGDKELTVTDFDANGDHDVLRIYGYSSAQSVVQQGADTVITLSAGDSIVLQNVTASALQPGDIVYSSSPWQAPQVPVSPPVYGTTTLHFTYDLAIVAGETINETGQNVGLFDELAGPTSLHRLDNFGAITVSAASGDVAGVVSNVTGGALNGNVTNEAGASFTVIDSDSTGSATGIDFDFWSFTNAGAFSVSAQGGAIGLDFYDSPPVTNQVGGTITVTSANGDATGIFDRNGERGPANPTITNNGTIQVTAGGDAYGIRSDRSSGGVNSGSDINNAGTILVESTGSGTSAIGIYALPGSTIINSGTITAQTAIQCYGSGDPGSFSLTNTGTINGDVHLLGVDCDYSFLNSGHVNGSIVFADGDSTYAGASGTLSGSITLGYGINTVKLDAAGGTVFGGGEADTITGGAGNDFFEIGRGANTINGKGGVNTLSIADADQGATVDLSKGTVAMSGTSTIANIQTVIGSQFNDTLIANSGGSTLIGGGGNDLFRGKNGADTFVSSTNGGKMTGGAGNDNFIYSAGDHKLIVTDFGANGDHDVLHVDGYASALSIKQVGLNTVIKLSDGGNITLYRVQASSLNAGNLVFDTHAWQGPAVPPSPPVYFSSHESIYIDYSMAEGLTIYKGETVDIQSHFYSDLDHSNYAIADDRFSLGATTINDLDNSGTIVVTSDDDNVVGFLDQGSGGQQVITNRTHASVSVTDTTGGASGLAGLSEYARMQFVNSGTVTVQGVTHTAGIGAGDVHNGAGATITAISTAGDAYGVRASDNVLNNGSISATGVTSAFGINDVDYTFNDGFDEGTILNNGTITAQATGAGGVSVGIAIGEFYNTDLPSHITNTGTITGDYSFWNADMGDAGFAAVVFKNSGTLNGIVDMGGSDSQLTNSGTINGEVIFRTVPFVWNAPGFFPPSFSNFGTLNGDIELFGSQATVTNTGTILSQTIDLGQGGGLTTTKGVVEIGHGLSAVRGTIGVAADGTLEGSGSITGNLAIAAGAHVEAQGGVLAITGAITGAGQIVIGGSATLEITGSNAAGVSFADGTGTLKLHTPATETGQIGGLQAGDVIDLAGIVAKTAALNGGVLTVTDSVGDTFNFAVSGNLAGNSFTIVDDGANGSDLVFGAPSDAKRVYDAIHSHHTDQTHAEIQHLLENVWHGLFGPSHVDLFG